MSVGLWFVPFGNLITLPIRYLVTYLHELGHALSAYATGGSASQMEIYLNGAGQVQVASGLPLITYSAGYLGSTAFGALLLLMARESRRAQMVLYGLGGTILFTALYWVRPPWSFGFAVGLTLAALLFLIAHYLNGRWQGFLLQFIAVQCCPSAVQDVMSLLRLNVMGSQHNDAAFLAMQTGIPAMVWALTWTIGSVVILWLAIKHIWRT